MEEKGGATRKGKSRVGEQGEGTGCRRRVGEQGAGDGWRKKKAKEHGEGT